MKTDKNIVNSIKYLTITIPVFLILQGIVILTHEFTHSTTAWLLGYKGNPLGIVWGNCVMMTGWDEGVHYSKIFTTPGNIDETLIGAMPLLMHSIVITIGILLLRLKNIQTNRWLFNTIYLYILANLMELIAYIIMRPFAPNGDTGHFNHGLESSPWYLFIIGTVLIIYALQIIYNRLIPQLYSYFAESNITLKWIILILSTFILFLWGSGLRILFYVYPDPQWKFGLIGIAGFIALLIIYNPSKATQAP